jgi:hypothetical protein
MHRKGRPDKRKKSGFRNFAVATFPDVCLTNLLVRDSALRPDLFSGIFHSISHSSFLLPMPGSVPRSARDGFANFSILCA